LDSSGLVDGKKGMAEETEKRRDFKTFKEPRNHFQEIDSASLCSLAGLYDNSISTRSVPNPHIQYSIVLKFLHRKIV
jgi:hypothetical protein